jgi:hypothetical protein
MCNFNIYKLGYAAEEVRLIFNSALADHNRYGMWDPENTATDKAMLLGLMPIALILIIVALCNL